MPEGDTVFDAAARLRPVLVGRRLRRSELRVPRFAAVDLTGRTVTAVRSRGKHLLVDVGPDAAGRDPVTLHLHLKMEGRLRVLPLGQRWRFPAHTVRFLLETEEHQVLGTELGFLRALSPAEAEEAVAHLGPDLLGSDWDAAEARRRLTARGGRTLGEALLDQRNLAGIGNVYRAELCFLRGVDPRTPVERVTGLDEMLGLAHRLLRANCGRPRVTTGNTRPGHRMWVYGRAGASCLRCGTPVETYRLGGQAGPGQSGGSADDGPAEPTDPLDRVCFSCPVCQPRVELSAQPVGSGTGP